MVHWAWAGACFLLGLTPTLVLTQSLGRAWVVGAREARSCAIEGPPGERYRALDVARPYGAPRTPPGRASCQWSSSIISQPTEGQAPPADICAQYREP